ncbi:MAG: DUF45 domain-containing protein [Methylophaga sp.]|nr:DUF45 domain-containing protein [Methylophaga sp.]
MQTIQGDGFIVTVIKSSRRKTTALKIRDGEVSIHIPNRLPLKFAREFITQKSRWIQNKLADQSLKQVQEKQFIEGEIFLFLNENRTLRLIQAESAPTIKINSQQLEFYGRLSRLSKTAIRAALVRWYKLQAEAYLNSRTAEIAHKINLTPHSITVKTYKARWGSCSIHADIQYNWKLMLAPANIIDYVIIHELCHIKHHNHSTDFWQLVEHHCPTFKSSRHWLKNNGYRLDI